MGNSYPLDITRIPFSGRSSRCMVFFENNGGPLGADNGLYLSQSTEGTLPGGAQFYRNKDYLLLTPVSGGRPLDYTYEATTSAVHMDAGAGTVDMTFASDGSLRIFAEGISLLVTAKMGFGDVAMKHGTAAEADMDGAAYFMIPTVGSVTVDSHYDLLTYRYTDPVIEFTPENGRLEIAVFDRSFKEGEFPEITGSFSECRGQMEGEFAVFDAKLTGPADGCEIERYGLWIANKPFPGLDGGAYPSNVITAVYPRAEEQPVLSMAFSDVDEAFGLITKFAPYMTQEGLLPEQATNHKQLFQTSSMYHGLAVLELLKNGEPDRKQCVALYDMLATIDGWWTKYRSRDGGRSFFYAYRFESGYKTAGIFAIGTPVTAPDLVARMVLQAEALAELANRLGLDTADGRWRQAAEDRLKYLVDELWADGRFTARAGGRTVESGSALCFVPIILGKRLPVEITSKLASDLSGMRYLVPGRGVRTEADGDVVDTVLTEVLAAGLYECGQTAAADALADAVAAAEKEYGLVSTLPAYGEPEYRCGGLYAPAACAARLYAESKRVKEA